MRNDLYARVIELLKSLAKHRYCEDGFFGCPKNEESFGHEGQPCDCDGDEAQQLLDELKMSGAL